jgi:hypothetical protein
VATDTPRSIVTYVHRPTRLARKKVQAAAITGPAIFATKSERTNEPAAIVTAKNPHRRGRLGDVPDMTPEEHKQRGDAAEALFRDLVRQATGKR